MMRKLCERIAAHTKKLRTQLFWAYFFVFALFLTTVILIMSGSVRDLLITQIGRNRTDVLRQIAERSNTIKTSSTTLSNLYSHEIQSHGYLEREMTEKEKQEAWEYLDSQKEIYDNIFSEIGMGYEVVLLGENGFNYYSDNSEENVHTLIQQPWYRYLQSDLNLGKKEKVQFSRTFRDNSHGISAYRFATGQFLGEKDKQSVLLILIDEQLLENLYSSVQTQDSEVYIYDQNGFIVSHPNKKMLGKQFINVDYMEKAYGINSSSIIKKLGKNYMLSTYLDEKTGWTIVEEIPTGVVFGVLNKAYLMLGTFLVLGLCLAFIVSLYMSRRISNPLTEMSEAMDEFGNSDFTPVCATNSAQEIDHLRTSFNHMAVEITRLMGVIQEREQQKRVLEVNFLRAQINPHFLYNMLFSIRCAVEVGKNRQAAEMIGAFIDLLRSTLSVKDTTVPLCDELESIRKYFVVQKLRYGERIQYEVEMQQETEHCMVPPLILQPLVENAIFHGIEAKGERGLVVIETALQGENLLLTIADDGAGMDAEQLEKVRAECERSAVKDTHSIGMSNVHNRIRLNYGEDYGLSIESSEGIGTTITLLMPAVFQKEEDHESINCG